MVFLSPNGKYNLSLSNCQAKWSSIPALDWIKKMCVTYFFDFFQTTYIDKTHQSTVNKICSKKGNFFTLFIDFRFATFFNSNRKIREKNWPCGGVVNMKLNIFPLCIRTYDFLAALPFYVQANFHRQIELSPSLSYP